MSNTWWTSDLHFFHKAILDFQSDTRPYSCVEEMNEDIIEKWNSQVQEGDKVYVLGDVVMSGYRNMQIVSRLKGNKHLVIGNHDNTNAGLPNLLIYFKTIKAYEERGSKGDRLICSHFPVHPIQLRSRFLLNVHGHTHSTRITNEDGSEDLRYFNVCWDANKGLVPNDAIRDRKEVLKN